MRRKLLPSLPHPCPPALRPMLLAYLHYRATGERPGIAARMAAAEHCTAVYAWQSLDVDVLRHGAPDGSVAPGNQTTWAPARALAAADAVESAAAPDDDRATVARTMAAAAFAAALTCADADAATTAVMAAAARMARRPRVTEPTAHETAQPDAHDGAAPPLAAPPTLALSAPDLAGMPNPNMNDTSIIDNDCIDMNAISGLLPDGGMIDASDYDPADELPYIPGWDIIDTSSDDSEPIDPLHAALAHYSDADIRALSDVGPDGADDACAYALWLSDHAILSGV